MIAKDYLRLQTVDNEGFRHLMKITVPLYTVPGRKAITKKIEEKYDYLSTCIKHKFNKINHFSITCDIWTDTHNTMSYLCLTVHYVNQGELQSTTLGVTELYERHTSEVIGKWVRQVLEDWNIDEEKVVVFVTDNAMNIKKLSDILLGIVNRYLVLLIHLI